MAANCATDTGHTPATYVAGGTCGNRAVAVSTAATDAVVGSAYFVVGGHDICVLVCDVVGNRVASIDRQYTGSGCA